MKAYQICTRWVMDTTAKERIVNWIGIRRRRYGL